MNKVFLDTNVILDFLLRRKSSNADFHKPMLDVLNYCIVAEIPLCTSILSLKDVFYILTRLTKSPQGKNKQQIIKQKIADFEKLIELAVTKKKAFYRAMDSTMSDLEDALQYFTAKDCGASIILTRNKKDFKNTDIRVLTPDEFLNLPISYREPTEDC